jgi:hypothetical protein
MLAQRLTRRLDDWALGGPEEEELDVQHQESVHRCEHGPGSGLPAIRRTRDS